MQITYADLIINLFFMLIDSIMTDYYNNQIACLIERNKNMKQERRYHYTNSLLLPTDNQLLAKIADGGIDGYPPFDPKRGVGVETGAEVESREQFKKDVVKKAQKTPPVRLRGGKVTAPSAKKIDTTGMSVKPWNKAMDALYNNLVNPPSDNKKKKSSAKQIRKNKQMKRARLRAQRDEM